MKPPSNSDMASPQSAPFAGENAITARSMSKWFSSPWMGIVILVATVAAYIPAIRADYIWDDDAYLTKNKLVQSKGGLGRIWFEPKASPQYYPLVFTSFWIEHQIWGLKPLGYHLLNVLLHGCNAILLWRLLRRLAIPGGLVAAMVFALHPVHVESVAWVTERKNVLSGLFYLSAMLQYLKFAMPLDKETSRPSRRSFCFSLVLFVCALLSKSVTASMPAAVLVILWWKRGRLTIKDSLPLIPFFIVGLTAAMHTAWLEKHHVGAEEVNWGLSALDRCLIAGRVIWSYAAKLIWPAELIFFYPRWNIDATQVYQYLFPLGAILVVVGLWKLRDRIGRGPLAATLFFCGTLFPVLGFVKVYPMIFSYVADHFQYLASIGVITLVVGVVARRLMNVKVPTIRAFAPILSVAVVSACFLLTRNRCAAYQNEETLWRDTIKQNPSAWAAYNNLGALMRDRKQNDEAFELYGKAVEMNPTYVVSLDNYGQMLLERHRYDEAFEIFRRAIRSDMYYAPSQRDYGRMLTDRGRWDEAIKHLTAASLLEPDSWETHEDLATAFYKSGQIDKAIEEYRRVLELHSDYALGSTNLATALAAVGKMDDAMQHLERALTLDPKLAIAHYTLGTILAALGRADEAILHFQKAIETQPIFPMAHDNLGIALAQRGKKAEALEQFQLAVQQAPHDANIRFNLAQAFEDAGRKQEAVKEYQEVLRINPADQEAQKRLRSMPD